MVNALEKKCDKKSISEIIKSLLIELKKDIKCELVQNAV